MTILRTVVARQNSRDKAKLWALGLLAIGMVGRPALAQSPTSGPADLARRVADRKLCESFERQYRIVVSARDESTTQASGPTATEMSGGPGLSLSPRRYLLLGGIVIAISLAGAMVSRLKRTRS